MRLTVSLLLVPICLLLAGCTDPDTYPLSGDSCGPDDPVQDVVIADCAPQP
ncbi:hypothetical protein SAMN05421759_110103 [Roseivivax lentus]|uniref:Lipoprotein n=1 Tax=Roseivivax lentus TaxID=633194 RepID=A0A1N7NVE8_9RHOB|nr:hypothetical protein [Roseivivax lentus]SIT02365.1 hypothetical protein SAMN05421759_110103 [Roseivivax lentus]